MAGAPNGTDLYIKVTPRSNVAAKKVVRRDGQASLHSQFASETSSATSLASDPASSIAPSKSTNTSHSGHRVRRYTITASKNAHSAPGQNVVASSKMVTERTKNSEQKPRRSNVVVTRTAAPEALRSHHSTSMVKTSEQEVPSEAWWNEQTGIDEPTQELTIDTRQYIRSEPLPPNSPSRIPRPKRSYPPSSYRDPLLSHDDEETDDGEPRLPADWKPIIDQEINHYVKPAAEPTKHLRSRKGSASVSSESRKSSQVPGPDRADAKNPMRARGSVHVASTPKSSSEASAPTIAHVRSRSTSHTSTTSSQRARHFEDSSLPPPEEVYQIMYFTQCPHTSPPANRPLDSQPMLQTLTADLLATPSHAIKTQLDLVNRTGRDRQIYTIAGLCPECDWKARRDAESGVLLDIAQKRYEMEKRLAYLEMQESEEEPNSPPTPEQPAREPSEHQMDLQLKILTLESDIEELEAQQDRNVKKTWKGFAARWGPGAVAIHKAGIGQESRGGSRATTNTVGTRSSVDNVHAEGRMKLDWIRPDLQKH